MELVGIERIRRAAKSLAGVAVRTPLLPQLWADVDRRLWLKPENLQPVGSFKIRGAFHASGLSISLPGAHLSRS